MLASLPPAGRIVNARVADHAPEILLAADDLQLFAAAYAGFVCAWRGTKFNESGQNPLDAQAAQEEIVRRALATSRPITVAELGARVMLGQSEIEAALASLESRGLVFRGHFTGGESTLQWCDRYVLERIHRNTLTLLRAEVEPCADHEFAAFRLKWQHLDDPDAPAGIEGLRAAMTQLCGLGFAPEFWERAILPARVADYRPEYLDLLCMSGEIAWVATPSDGESAEAFPSLVAFAPRGGRLLRLPFAPRPAMILKPRRLSRNSRNSVRSTLTSWPTEPASPIAIPFPHFGGWRRLAWYPMTVLRLYVCFGPILTQ